MSGAPDVVALTQALVRHRTEDPPGREIELARFVHRTLAETGIAAELDEFAPGRANVLGRVAGRGERPALIFSAHLDTMPAGDEVAWVHPPFDGDLEEGRLYGRGAADMKGGLAAMLAAAARVQAGARPPAGDLLLAFSAGESSSCIGARRFVETGVLAGADAILVSEPSSMRLLTAETGALWLRILALGVSGHASGGAGRTSNAVERLVDAIVALRTVELPGGEHPLLGTPSLSVGTIAGGDAVNLTPDRATAGIDLRYLPGTDADALVRAVAGAVGDGVTVEVLDDKPPVEAPADHPFVGTCAEVLAEVNGIDEPPGGVCYFSDSNVLCPALGIPRVIIGPGPLGMSGQRDEHVPVADLERAVEVYARVAARWLETGPG